MSEAEDKKTATARPGSAAALEKKKAEEEIQAADYKVTVYVDDGDDTSGDGSSGEGSAGSWGHAWVEVEDSTTGEKETVGFYPKDGTHYFVKGPGSVDPDGWRRQQRCRIAYALTKKQYKAVKAKIAKDKKSPPEYAVTRYNCVDWAMDVVKAAGQKINDPVGSNTPEGLGNANKGQPGYKKLK